jgi:actin-related protein
VAARGGRHANSCQSEAESRDIVFSCDSDSRSIPDVLTRVLGTYDAVSRVIVIGSTSFRFDRRYLEGKCGVSFNGRCVKYSLVPERNKSAWLGASIVPDIAPCQHRFYTASDWNDKGSRYTPLMFQ